MSAISALISLVSLLLLAYLVRGSRELGTKLSKLQSANSKGFKELHEVIKAQESSSKRREQLMYLPMLEKRGVDWKFDVSVTSHPARFEALAVALTGLRSQILQPQNIWVYIADGDLPMLPSSITELEKSGFIKIEKCQDLGSGKKLIPSLANQGKHPIITIDDDLYFENDLFLQLMINHYLYPSSIIAARVHRVTEDELHNVLPFSEWHKHFDLSEGPAADFMPTSGAGTLFPPKAMHQDSSNADLYLKLAKNTDDLWWYFQARRNGTLVRRLSGLDTLNFIDSTQEVGLWKNGNQDRNEVNLKALLAEYGNPIRL
jgi:hypothetical protein